MQQRRPPPAADTGRSCWGRGQQDTSAAQGTKWSLGTATRLSAATSFFRFDNSFGIIKGEQPLIRASRASKVAGAFLVLFWHAKENLTLPQQQFTPRHQRATPLKRKRANVPHGTLALSPHLCAAAVGMRTVYSMYPSRSSRWAVAGTPLSVIRRMAWSMVFTKMRTSFTIEMR